MECVLTLIELTLEVTGSYVTCESCIIKDHHLGILALVCLNPHVGVGYLFDLASCWSFQGIGSLSANEDIDPLVGLCEGHREGLYEGPNSAWHRAGALTPQFFSPSPPASHILSALKVTPSPWTPLLFIATPLLTCPLTYQCAFPALTGRAGYVSVIVVCILPYVNQVQWMPASEGGKSRLARSLPQWGHYSLFESHSIARLEVGAMVS